MSHTLKNSPRPSHGIANFLGCAVAQSTQLSLPAKRRRSSPPKRSTLNHFNVMSAIDSILAIAEPMEPAAKRLKSATEVKMENRPNVWFHPLDKVGFSFAAKEEEPQIHVTNNGPVPLTIQGTVQGSHLTREASKYVVTNAVIKIQPSATDMEKLEAMQQEASQWLFDNKSELSKEWKRKLKGKTASDVKNWWKKPVSQDDETPCVNAKRGFHLSFKIYKLTSIDPLKYDDVAGKDGHTKDDPMAPWQGDAKTQYIPKGTKVFLRIKPNFVSYQNDVGLNIRFQEQVLIIKPPAETQISKVDFKTVDFD